jgi:hypothetical protein
MEDVFLTFLYWYSYRLKLEVKQGSLKQADRALKSLFDITFNITLQYSFPTAAQTTDKY